MILICVVFGGIFKLLEIFQWWNYNELPVLLEKLYTWWGGLERIWPGLPMPSSN